MTVSARNSALGGRIATGDVCGLLGVVQIRDRMIERCERCETGTLVNEIAAGDNGRTAIRNRGPAAPLSHPYCAIQPPSTAIGSPVTNDDASEHSHITASAISSGLPIRPTGSAASRSFSV